ncbi:MAG: hypothetical protein IKO53_00635 [Lachnospiraceae bacterium]|nr:hypothetical protein [Lachnospiraceae bacterium]
MYKKKLEEMNLIDDFLMNAATTDQEVGEACCRCMLSVLLQRKIGRVHVISQRFLPGAMPGQRGIRMDVEVTEEATDGSGMIANVYDMEPHTMNDMDFPRANRFRQAKIDGRYMKSGDNDFKHLPDLYVITIMNFDLFQKGYMIYDFRTTCMQDPDIPYDDGLYRIYFNTTGTKGGSKSIKNMLNYIQNSASVSAVDDATEELEGYVHKVKTDPEVRRSIMTFGDIIDREKRESFELATKSTRMADILDLLSDIGGVTDEIAEKLGNIKEEENLKNLHKLAARAESMEAFEKCLDEVLEAEAKKFDENLFL